ncbi:AraC family ligand binding domain-containing protein [Paenibacillus hexagrammi]|uniref:AraC family ligand binding domain-containing protein n=2 Tax=Paenibacillus hexagrammi TaxID=2908839 RepID=A0ABY3SIM9_9BACL|nr:AraC family ligand binding domain-containing protein [Paenibacillus sp. YPD9-1]
MEISELAYHKSSTWYEEERQDEQWTLVLVSYGKCVYWVEERKYVLEKGQLLLIPKNVPLLWEKCPYHDA